MVKAYVLVSTKPGTSEEVTNYLREARNVKGVVSADSVFGRYDAIITVEVSDLPQLSQLIYKVIEKIPNVVKTETCIVLFGEGGK
ncbi:MAG: Lrp/AsnC ligand binding domain-containing protein [Candidatus Caldarchaeum sp.]|nr:Lrp/AsnC ligand binding domain-containing protein [Candidatus Caldarchaeum sp.]MCS7137937.1 Lrp/AsnC ligand binding domain-containing protein [Candidatus Caldarchaeum sp.]MDW8359265.1 Lrp/AsnC ligand binding domain-containing protein [Candidatus Caldarchaeum sp.]